MAAAAPTLGARLPGVARVTLPFRAVSALSDPEMQQLTSALAAGGGVAALELPDRREAGKRPPPADVAARLARLVGGLCASLQELQLRHVFRVFNYLGVRCAAAFQPPPPHW